MSGWLAPLAAVDNLDIRNLRNCCAYAMPKQLGIMRLGRYRHQVQRHRRPYRNFSHAILIHTGEDCFSGCSMAHLQSMTTAAADWIYGTTELQRKNRKVASKRVLKLAATLGYALQD